jgi:hypothetical protein
MPVATIAAQKLFNAAVESLVPVGSAPKSTTGSHHDCVFRDAFDIAGSFMARNGADGCVWMLDEVMVV